MNSLGHTFLILILYVLAVARLTRLINFDTVLDPLRLWIGGRARAAKALQVEAVAAEQVEIAAAAGRRAARWNTLAYFLGCPWCVGFWLSLATAAIPVAILGWQWGCIVPVAFACSHVVGMLAPLTADEDIEIVDGEA